MTKAATAGALPQAGVATMLAPMQESIDRLRQASEKFSSTYSDLANHQLEFLQKAVFDTLIEIQTLQRVRNPAEFLELGTEFAWQQAERSLKAFGELGNEVCGCWFDALKGAPALVAKGTKSQPVH